MTFQEGPAAPVSSSSRGEGARPPRRWGLVVVAVLALGGLGALLRRRAQAVRNAPPPAGREGPGQGDRPVPVLTATAALRDVPVYLEGLGTVSAFYTVTVRPRVDGQLVSVAFHEGQTVHRGDVLAQLDTRPFQVALRQAEAVAARDRALLDLNRRTLARDRALAGQNFISQQETDNAAGAVSQVEAALRADEAAVASARLSLEWTRVVSPLDGVTGLRQVDPGNMVRAADVNGLVVVRQVDPIAVLFTLPQDELPRVFAQMARGALPVEVYSRDGATHLASGQLAVVDNDVNPGTATMRLKAVFPNPQRALWPDQFVKTRLLLTTLRGALTVPAAAVQRGPQGTFVYVVTGDHATMHPVRVDHLEGEDALIASGLAVGDVVVTEGQTRLREGARVQPRAAGGPAEGPPGAPSGEAARGHRGGGAGGAPGGGGGGGRGRGDGGTWRRPGAEGAP